MTTEGNLTMLAPPSRILSDHVAEQLRKAIINDQLKPGQHIVEREIAEAMQTSRGPVRDALMLLEKEGLVIRYPHRGTFVTELSLEDAEEIYTLRQAIESLAVEYVVRRATPEELDGLDEQVKEMATMVQEGYDLGGATELDLEFHRTLCRISGHKRLLEAWEALSAQTRVLLLTHRRRNPSDFHEKAVSWHRRLVDALRARDLEQAKWELCRHLAVTIEGLLDSAEEGEA
jgi:DNA-binding GntR family transcriptional regulator